MSEDISHYKPKHPLPEEIQNLPRHDTVCKFCGVSYLIHNEIKRLEDKIQEYEKQVSYIFSCMPPSYHAAPLHSCHVGEGKGEGSNPRPLHTFYL